MALNNKSLATHFINVVVILSIGEFAAASIAQQPCFREESNGRCSVPKLANGYLTQMDDSSGEDSGEKVYTNQKLSSGQGIVLHCNFGLQSPQSATKRSVCSLSSQWIPPVEPLACKKPVTCRTSELPVVPNGRYVDDYYYLDSASFEVSSIRQFVCFNGYHFSNGEETVTSTCQPNGQWSPIETRCIPTPTCTVADLPSLENGIYLGLGRARILLAGTNVRILCMSGYDFSGPTETVTCLQDSTWTQWSGACVPRNPSKFLSSYLSLSP